MIDYEWKSGLAPMIQRYIEFKRLSGLKFEKQERCLRQLDHYYYYSGYEAVAFTKESVDPFMYGKDESLSTWRLKEGLMSDFSRFLNDRGHRAYALTPRLEWPRSEHVPHIYTREERIRFLAAVDSFPPGHGPNREAIDPVLFRVLIGTGCRLSEALSLRVSDFDRPHGAIVIRHSKNGMGRTVPLCGTLSRRVESFVGSFHKGKETDGILFPGENGVMDKSTAYRHFRDYLLMAGIPHTGNGPRIHDWRHTAAVENLRRWAENGEDLSSRLPYLSAFLGHADFRATQYYLRLTAEVYPHLVAQMEDACWGIIPEGGFTSEE